MKERFAANHKLLRRKSGEQKNKKITSSTKFGHLLHIVALLGFINDDF